MSLLRAYIAISILNIGNYLIRGYVVKAEPLGRDVVPALIIETVSVILYALCLVCIYAVKSPSIKWVMITFGYIIFGVYYEYKLAVCDEFDVYFSILYLLPLMQCLGSEYSTLISYIFSSILFAYIIIRAIIRKMLGNSPISNHIQAAYTFYLIFIYGALSKSDDPTNNKSPNKSVTPTMDASNDIILENVPVGIIKYNKTGNTVTYLNNKTKEILSVGNQSVQEFIIDFIRQNNLLGNGITRSVTHQNKKLSIYSQLLLDTYILIISNTTCLEGEVSRDRLDLNFFTTITHELRTPLNVSEGTFGLLKEHLSKEGEAIYNVCHRAIVNIKFLIRDTLV
jgi:hypothetical protein